MGKVRTSLIKRMAWQMLEQNPSMFTKDFEQNKQAVSKLLVVKSKKLRNQIAGYITHLVKIMSKPKKTEE